MPESAATRPKMLTVSELTRSIRSLLEMEVGRVWVEGEISNYRKQGSGHQYFTLKDDRSQLPCVLFSNRGAPVVVAANLADGQCVQAFGQVTVYEARGQYQLIVEIVQPRGLGALQARFEALKRKLQAEGLFELSRKKPLPRFPVRVGLVTSGTGAALQDMLHVLNRRAPWVEILLYPVRVQGQGAASEIAGAIIDFNRWAAEARLKLGQRQKVDLIVVGRGGGSLEDLFEFNEEVVARAIADSALPVVSAVGHEIDFTLADFAADVRAPTPSAAAEVIVPDRLDVAKQLNGILQTLGRRLTQRLERARERLAGLARGTLERELRRYAIDARQRLDGAEERLRRVPADRVYSLRTSLQGNRYRLLGANPQRALDGARHRLRSTQTRLDALLKGRQANAGARLAKISDVLRLLGPQGTLERGYSITLNASGAIVHSAAVVQRGERLLTRLRDGIIHSTAD